MVIYSDLSKLCNCDEDDLPGKLDLLKVYNADVGERHDMLVSYNYTSQLFFLCYVIFFSSFVMFLCLSRRYLIFILFRAYQYFTD